MQRLSDSPIVTGLVIANGQSELYPRMVFGKNFPEKIPEGDGLLERCLRVNTHPGVKIFFKPSGPEEADKARAMSEASPDHAPHFYREVADKAGRVIGYFLRRINGVSFGEALITGNIPTDLEAQHVRFLSEMHERGLSHNDLMWWNMLVDGDGILWFVDAERVSPTTHDSITMEGIRLKSNLKMIQRCREGRDDIKIIREYVSKILPAVKRVSKAEYMDELDVIIAFMDGLKTDAVADAVLRRWADKTPLMLNGVLGLCITLECFGLLGVGIKARINTAGEIVWRLREWKPEGSDSE